MNLLTQAGRPFDTRTIESDVRAMWMKGRFQDIRVETTEEKEGAAVVFQVTEEPDFLLHTIRIEPHSFGLNPKVAERTPINRLRAQEMAVEARKRLNAEGYPNARVDYALVPISKHEADLRLTIKAGDAVDVKDIEFLGEPGVAPKELRGALRAMRIRRVLPRVPDLWGGWKLFPAYSSEAVEADINRLRSWYLAKGYFDADVRLRDAKIEGKRARIRIGVRSGPLYRVPEWRLPGAHARTARQLCSCLLSARREAERAGVLDFSAGLKVERAGESAEVSATVEQGPPYRVGRIEFTGNHHYKDSSIRRNFALTEGAWFDRQLLRESIGRVNRTMWFEPAEERDVLIQPHPETGEADLAMRLTERRHRAWAISGPLGPASFAGPVNASITTRLPPWGAGLFELSTYAASVSLLGFAHPILPFLGITSKGPVLPVLALARPFSPGEGWRSGFALAPQAGWRFSAFSYAATQAQHRVLPVLAGDRRAMPGLPVTVEHSALLCEPSKPRLATLRSIAATMIKLLGAAR